MKNVKLILAQEYNSLEDARRIELKLKRLKRKDYIAKIIADGIIKITVN
jgi:predicted GIY-YIG superfamily endonuclease